jgi:hypothetical protein
MCSLSDVDKYDELESTAAHCYDKILFKMLHCFEKYYDLQSLQEKGWNNNNGLVQVYKEFEKIANEITKMLSDPASSSIRAVKLFFSRQYFEFHIVSEY